MPGIPLYVLNSGIVSSVGLSAPAACAAIRSKLTNPTESRYLNSAGDWILCHAVPLEKSWRGREKLARMAAMVIEESMAGVPREQWSEIPLLLCVAERTRVGRLDGTDEELYSDI